MFASSKLWEFFNPLCSILNFREIVMLRNNGEFIHANLSHDKTAVIA